MITQGQLRLISRHYAGHGEPYAFLELAQEHFLLWMMREGLFDIGPEDVVFKGGTAIRKYRLGLRGRFSTDLDFAIADGAYADHIITSLDQGLIDLEGVRFRATSIDLPAAKAQCIAVVDGLGETMEAKIEFTRRPTLLMPTMPETRPDIPGFSPQLIGFDLPLVPLMRLEENLSEKLARFRRIIRSRDLYDLGLIMGGRVDYTSMLGTVASMFGPMGTPQGELEERLGQLSPKDLWWAEQQYEELRTAYRSLPAEPGPVV